MAARSLPRILAVLAVATQVLAVAPSHAQQPDAKTSLAAGDKAAKSKDWAKAQSDYRAAYAATPSVQALSGLANASYEMGAEGEAYEAYDELIRTYPNAMGRGAKASAEKRLKELESKTGALTILVNEPGAEVSIDDKKIGTSPVRALLRVKAGSHRVRVSKSGFAPFEKPVEVGSNAKISVDANLTRESKTGKISVKESSAQAVRVFIDGVDVGPAPYEGDLSPGPHEVSVRSPTLGAKAQRIEIEAGKTAEVSMSASSASGRLEIATSDGLGVIYVDGKVMGEGQFSGELPAGPHVIRVTREGFVPFEKTVDLGEKQSLSESVTLRTAGQSLDAVNVEQDRPFYGFYGGFGLLGALQVNALGSSLDASSDSCKSRGALSCATPSPLGAGAFGYFGFTWLPVGIELFVGGLFDQATQKAEFGAPAAGFEIPEGPARTEEYRVIRVGGAGAIRARATFGGRTLRVSVSGGPGIAYKQLVMERKTSTPDGFADRFVPDDGKPNLRETANNKLNYVSPAIVGDLAVHWRVTQSTALSLGVMGWFETAGNEVAVQNDRSRVLVSDAPGAIPKPLPTPRYEPASGVQFFLGPYLGMIFGP